MKKQIILLVTVATAFFCGYVALDFYNASHPEVNAVMYREIETLSETQRRINSRVDDLYFSCSRDLNEVRGLRLQAIKTGIEQPKEQQEQAQKNDGQMLSNVYNFAPCFK